MNESMREWMRVGIIHFMMYPATAKGEGPILETLKKICVDPYFDAVAISWIKDPAVRKQAKRMLEEAHMSVVFGAHPHMLTTGLNINDLDPEGRKKALASMKQGIEEAAEMGAASFVYLSGKYSEDKKEDAYQALLDSTRELCAHAKAQGGMTVIHENFDYAIDKKSLIGPAALARRFAADVRKDFDKFGLSVDLSHIPLIGENPEQALIPVRDYLLTVDIGNCVMGDPSHDDYGDMHPRFGFPHSVNDVPQLVEFLRVLKQIGFLNKRERPIVSFEVKPFKDEDPDLLVAGSQRTLNAAWAALE